MESRYWMRPVGVFAVAAMFACGGGDAGSSDGGMAEEAGEEAPAAMEVANAGSISGTITFSGTAPEMMSIDMSAEPDCHAAYGEAGPMGQTVLVGEGGGLANAFVYISEGAPAGGSASGAAQLDQENCRYTPHVLGVMAGQDIEISNSDNLLHNINANPTENRGFNISQPRAGITSTQSFSVAEVMIPVRCDVHGWMQAYVGVLDHPYFAVTMEDGSFSIANVPAGDYTLTAWHEELGEMTAVVTVSENTDAGVSMSFGDATADAEVPMGVPIVVRHNTDRIRLHRTSP